MHSTVASRARLRMPRYVSGSPQMAPRGRTGGSKKPQRGFPIEVSTKVFWLTPGSDQAHVDLRLDGSLHLFNSMLLHFPNECISPGGRFWMVWRACATCQVSKLASPTCRFPALPWKNAQKPACDAWGPREAVTFRMHGYCEPTKGHFIGGLEF